MTASPSDPGRDPQRYLADTFDELTGASTLDSSVLAAVHAASELADADGLCLLSQDGDRCVVALAHRDRIYLCDLRSTRLYQDSTRRMVWAKEDSIPLPTGEIRRIGVAFIVPLRAASGYAAVGVFWQPARSPNPQALRGVELLAKALGVATRQRTQQRISTDLQHRLRNNLAVTRSIIRRSHETAESAEHFALHVEARIGALARMQGTLAAVGDAGVELEDLVRTELIAGAVPEQRYRVEGPAVRLHAKGAELVGLTVHELMTNSVKFGSLGVGGGSLAVAWTVHADPLPRLRIDWLESGANIVSAAPRRRGFGHELVECTLPYELGAQTRLTFSPGGVTCEIEIPLEACATGVESALRQVARGGAR